MRRETVFQAVIFCLLIVLCSGCGPSGKENLLYEKLDYKTASELIKSLKADSSWDCDSLTAVVIDTAQLAAMNDMKNNGSSFPAYRIYVGYDASTQTKVANVVGMDANGADLYQGDIFKTELGLTGPCPPTCDVNRSMPSMIFPARIFPCGTFKAFAIDKEALDAMNYIKSNDPACKGFRIYYGIDATNTAVRSAVVFGIDVNKNDLRNIVKKTTLVLGGPCPTVCDVNSPLN